MPKKCTIVKRGPKMPAKWGSDYVRGDGWKPILRTAAGWRQYAERKQRREKHPVIRTMVVRVSNCGDYYRINTARQPF